MVRAVTPETSVSLAVMLSVAPAVAAAVCCGLILKAFWTTVKLTLLPAIGAVILGTALAAMRLAPVPG